MDAQVHIVDISFSQAFFNRRGKGRILAVYWGKLEWLCLSSRVSSVNTRLASAAYFALSHSTIN